MSDTIPGRRSYFKVIYKLLSPAKLFLVTGKKRARAVYWHLKPVTSGRWGLLTFK